MLPTCTYQIRYLGYIIAGTKPFLTSPPEGVDETSLVATNGDVSINGQKLVENYGPLCYSVSISEWTLTRHVGSRIITIVGPGGTSRTEWDATHYMQHRKLPTISMSNGDVHVGSRLVIKCGRSHDGLSDVPEEPVEETPRPSRNDGVVTPRTREQIPEDTRLLPRAYEQAQCAGPTTTSYAYPNLGQRIFQLIHGVHTVDRYPDCFIYTNPETGTYNSEIDLSTSSSGTRYLFLKGSVWLDGQEVIRDGSQLPEGHSGRPQPHFDIFD